MGVRLPGRAPSLSDRVRELRHFAGPIAERRGAKIARVAVALDCCGRT
ncbi:MAG: hypothetical protein KatS3mg065_1134 [Chloroflexota bacterium]|nr:MAG: hypothetical protein KatS3mg065_1134 [Chloroflexota bacterium]